MLELPSEHQDNLKKQWVRRVDTYPGMRVGWDYIRAYYKPDPMGVVVMDPQTNTIVRGRRQHGIAFGGR